MKRLVIKLLLTSSLLLNISANLFSQPGKKVPSIQVIVDSNKASDTISKLIYGQFIELLFNYFEGGLWAEMLGDRKFFYPITSSDELKPLNTRHYLGRWKPVGEGAYVETDNKNVFTGEHSPKIILSPLVQRGITQKGLSFQKDSAYNVRIVLAADQKPTVQINLLWTNEKYTIQTIADSLSSSYKTFLFTFKSPVTTTDAAFEITAAGKGALWIGATSLMPASNVNGFRADILEQFKYMNLGNLRWGGNASSGYIWQNGVGDRDKRPPIYDYAWNAMESNDVGTHEYLDLCELLGAEPNIGVNAGLGDAYSAAQWVEYVNGSVETPMGKLRAANGHAEPFAVKWWGIGNEMYGKWQLGNMSAFHYAIKHNMFAKAMKKADSSIILVASGATPYEMGCTSVYSGDYGHDTLPFAISGKYDWSGNLLANCSENFNYLAEHLYPLGDSSYNVQLQKFVSAKDDPVIDKVRRLPNRLKGSVEAFRKYQQRYPVIKEKGITLAVDEWRMKDGGWGMKDALATAEAYHEIFRNTDIIKMSTFTSTDAPSCLLYDATRVAIQPSGLVIRMFSTYFGSIPVSVEGDSKQPAIKGTIGVDRPEVSSGSDTYPLDISAAMKADKKAITISIVNPTAAIQKAEIKFKDGVKYKMIRSFVITGPSVNSYNELGKSPVVEIKESPAYKQYNGTLMVSPYSINLYEFNL